MSNDVLFEIGVEELPARFITEAEKQLKTKTEEWLASIRIRCEQVKTFATPRRLAVLLTDVQEEQETLVEEARGPAMKIAKDEEGNWTKAAIGFTKGQGKSVEDIYEKEVKGVPYIFVEKTIEGKRTTELLPSFKEVIENLTFPQTMRWHNFNMRFSRPIRWLLAMNNSDVIDFELLNIQTGNKTFGHRFLSGEVTIEEASEYEKILEENFVIADVSKREAMVQAELERVAKEQNFHVEVDESLLREVTHLVEYPTAFSGAFEETFLELPDEVLITSMKEHQRYFPAYDDANKLLPYFVGVRNGDDKHLDNVIRGNEKVLRARLTDAQFFYEEDLKVSLDTYQEALGRVVFQEKLGTMQDKVNRIMLITEKMAEALKLNSEDKAEALRVAELAKFDLTTHMVNEFTELQGVIGEKYALHFKETAAVAKGIKEHYMPTQATGELPESLSGSIVSIADKLDTIIGFISVGLTPSGSQDPYGLRRQALGILRILKEKDIQLPFETTVDIVRDVYDQVEEIDLDDVREFFKLRANYLLKSAHIEQDVIEAILERNIGLLRYTIEKARTLSAKRGDDNFRPVQEALLRVLNIAEKGSTSEVDPNLFETDSEKDLHKALIGVQEKYEAAVAAENAQEALEHISSLSPYIHAFFENNMVMADDEKIKGNRIALLSSIGTLIADYADLSKVQWKHQ